MTTYDEFLERKRRKAQPVGLTVSDDQINPVLHPWQRRIVSWATRVGRGALWADTGLGKTFMQLEYARLSGERSLIVAPLAVCRQTTEEASKLGLNVPYVRSDGDAEGPGIWITNYEMASKFSPSSLDAVVLDEASILKQSDGKTRTALIRHFSPVKRRLACTATPSPNDIEELTNQAEFVGVMSRPEMLAAYFVHDDEGWRIKGHAKQAMFRWMATWAVALRRPSDIGGDDTGYILPGLQIIPHSVSVPSTEGMDLGGVSGRSKVRQATIAERCQRAAELVTAEPSEPWIVWCGLNAEADMITRLIPGAVNVRGSMSPEDKSAALLGFSNGDIRVIVTKPSIASFGLNWQHCARMAFCGLGDSYEQYYQAIRRCHRYGQTRKVYAHVILSELESAIAENVARKESQSTEMTEELVREMRRAGELKVAA